MVKAIYFIKRKPGMSLENFRHYWLNNHAEVVRKVAEIRKYVQSHTLDSGYSTHEPAYDGIAELWYDNTDVMRQIVNTPESRAAGEDDANFIDMTKFGFILVDERVQKEAPTTPEMPKLIAFLTRKAGMDVDKFQAYWRGHHGPVASKIPQVRRYVQCHVRRSAYMSGRSPVYDGVAETWFENLDAMRESGDTEEYRAVRADEANFLEPGKIQFIIAREYPII
ncbi:MAG TPA: EthD domain-containing protein [Candidatus Binataceae bacterium]